MSKKHTCRSWRVDAHYIHTCNSPKLCKRLNFLHPEWAGWITSPSCLAIYVWLAAQAKRGNEPWRWWMVVRTPTIPMWLQGPPICTPVELRNFPSNVVTGEGKHCDGASHLQVWCLISIQSKPLLHGSQGRQEETRISRIDCWIEWWVLYVCWALTNHTKKVALGESCSGFEYME